MAILPNIPPDVLGEIFYLTLRGPISNEQESLFPWSLGRVCKSWRHVFVTYPALWAFITLDVSHVDDDAILEKICNRLLLCLQRSGDHPLNLILSAREYDRDQRSPWIQVWEAFISCSHRWKNIVLRGGAPQFRDLTTNREGGFPLLQSFMLCPQRQFDCNAFHDAPRLTQFGLAYYDNNGIVSHARSFPLSQLTKFTLATDGILSDTLKALLESLHSVQELYFMASQYASVPATSPFPPRCLEHLRVLEVPFALREEILQAIKAPSLVELRLETGYDPYPAGDGGYEMMDFYRDVVEAFIELSSCHLRKLVLTGFTDEQAAPLIRSFPDLEELCVDDLHGCPWELLGSRYEDLKFTAFPNLRILTLSSVPRDADIVKALTNILKLRNGVYIGKPSIPLRPLEKIVIKRRHEWSPVPCFYEPEPIPHELEDAISKWARFKVEVQFDQL